MGKISSGLSLGILADVMPSHHLNMRLHVVGLLFTVVWAFNQVKLGYWLKSFGEIFTKSFLDLFKLAYLLSLKVAAIRVLWASVLYYAENVG